MIDFGNRAWLPVLLLIAGCANPGQPPVAERSPVFSATPEYYQVTPGDTLYSIAWRFDLDFRTLARANDLASPYTIFTGQRVRLALPRIVEQKAPAKARGNTRLAARASWSWPTRARVSRSYSNANSGLNFKLANNTDVTAAGAGEETHELEPA